ncbi:MAG: hypothetical protein ACP5PR_01605 [Minisyncoccia bacterium]
MFLDFVDKWVLCSSNTHSLCLNNVFPFILQWWIAIAITVVFIGYFLLIFKKPLGFNRKISKITWLVLLVFIVLFLIINLSFNSFRAADEEWASIYRAKTILDGNKRVYVQDNSGIVFPLLVAGLLKISHFYFPLIRIFNIFLGTISLFLIFECTYLIFDNEKASLLSVFVYSLTPWTYRYTSILFGLPTLVHFLSLLSLLTILLAFKYHKFYLHILSLISLLVLNQTKLEYLPYYIIYLSLFFITSEYKRFNKKEIAIFIIIVFICFVPAIIKHALFQISFLANPNWCGIATQTTEHYSYGSVITKVDDILQDLINQRIKLSYFLSDLKVFLKFWSQPTLILPILISIIGIYLAFKEYSQKKLFILFPIIFFLILAIGYLLDCGWYEARHAISAYGFLIIFSGYSLWWLLSKINFIKKGRIFIYSFVFILLGIQLIICIQDLKNLQTDMKTFSYEYQSYYLYKALMKDISIQSGTFITLDNNSKYMLQLWGYQAESFNDYIHSNEAVIKYQEVINHFFSSDILNFRNKIYFIKSPACGWFDLFMAFCEKAQKESKAILKEVYIINDENNKLQLIVLKN